MKKKGIVTYGIQTLTKSGGNHFFLLPKMSNQSNLQYKS
jgi:hypothetical protein